MIGLRLSVFNLTKVRDMVETIELYQPLSVTEGDIFMSAYCYRCVKYPHDSDAKSQCMIVMRSMAWSTDDKEYPRQWRYINGEPTCTAFKSREEFNAERRERRKNARKP